MVLLSGICAAAQNPVLGNIEAPYAPLQSAVTLAGQNWLAGATNYGPVGTPLVLTGSNLGTSGTVQFVAYKNGVVDGAYTVPATPTSWAANMVLVTVPAGARSGLITVTVGGKTSYGLPFIVTNGTYASASCPAGPSGAQLQVTTSSLSDGLVGQGYSVTLGATGGTLGSGYHWSITNGSLPAGLTLSASGAITGTPTASTGQNPTPITFQVADNGTPQQVDLVQLALTIQAHVALSGTIYGYAVHYDAVGNVTWIKDGTLDTANPNPAFPSLPTGSGIMGEWNFGDSVNTSANVPAGAGYDSLSRLALASTKWPNGTQQTLCWSYDSFGNRKQQMVGNGAFSGGGAATCSTSGAILSTSLADYDANNRVVSTNARGVTAIPAYDGAGNMLSDGSNQYLYDAEGRVCAVASDTSVTGYIYDAEGARVAKGKITGVTLAGFGSIGCDPSAWSGFQFTADYVLGAGGEELTQLDGQGHWQRTNVYAGSKLIGTYDLVNDQPALHFHFTDPLGTRRMQVSGMLANLGQPELDFQSLPFGDDQIPLADPYGNQSANDASPLHFTGKERDQETGNDYFEARYYGSTMGRFMTPDPSGLFYADPSNPQSLNLYSYVYNNPLINIDPSGMECVWDDGSYDAADDETTGSASGCSRQGGTYVPPRIFEGVEGNQYGSWSDKASASIGFDWRTPSARVNTPNDAPTLTEIGSMLLAGSVNDFFKWLSCNGKDNCYPGAQIPLAPEYQYGLGGGAGNNNYCGPNGAGAPLNANDWYCAVHDYNYLQIAGTNSNASIITSPRDSVITTPLLRQADAILASHVVGAEGAAMKAVVKIGAVMSWAETQKLRLMGR